MNHHRTKLLLAPLAASALIFSLAACGSDDEGASDTVAETTDTTIVAETTDTTIVAETTDTTMVAETTETTMADEMSSDTTMADDMDEVEEMAGGEATVGDITVTDVWVRQPAEGQMASAAYGMITNDGDTDITLVGGSVPFGATVEIHETLMDAAGTMQMQEREEGFVIAAGETFTLEPGGPHIMMLDIDPADFVGEIDVTMIFDDGTEIVVTAPVRSLDGMAMDDGMDDGMDDDMDDDMTETTDG